MNHHIQGTPLDFHDIRNDRCKQGTMWCQLGARCNSWENNFAHLIINLLTRRWLLWSAMGFYTFNSIKIKAERPRSWPWPPHLEEGFPVADKSWEMPVRPASPIAWLGRPSMVHGSSSSCTTAIIIQLPQLPIQTMSKRLNSTIFPTSPTSSSFQAMLGDVPLNGWGLETWITSGLAVEELVSCAE